MQRLLFSDVGSGVYSTGTGGVSLFAVEGTLLRCNVQDLLSSCCGGSLSSIVRWAPLSLWPWASLELWHKPQVQEGTCGSFLVAVVPPLGVLCGEDVLPTCGIWVSSLVFMAPL